MDPEESGIVGSMDPQKDPKAAVALNVLAVQEEPEEECQGLVCTVQKATIAWRELNVVSACIIIISYVRCHTASVTLSFQRGPPRCLALLLRTQ